MELLGAIWNEDFPSFLAALMLFCIMAFGFWLYVGNDPWVGAALIVIGALLFLAYVYARYVVAHDPRASIALHLFAQLRHRYLYIGLIAGGSFGILGAYVQSVWRRIRGE